LSDERAEIVKILNNGNARGFPVLRTEVTRSREFDPRAYTVFGPKIVATRGYFEDRALESRCLTEDMGTERLRDDVPLNLDHTYKWEARELRNKLLLYRLRQHAKRRDLASLPERGIEPRLRQIFAPFFSLIDDADARIRILELLKSYQRDLVADRSVLLEARILESIRVLLRSEHERVQVADITRELLARYASEFDRQITAKWVGATIRKRLGLKPSKSRGVFVLGPAELHKLPRLYEKYGLVEEESASGAHADMGDVSERAGPPQSAAA
ncbi:MAG: hypothetical protein M3Q69_00595, partial [Acidobacteriota bacterium]|nr:hypothetical protein [Acidobacteriota bacterium]